MFSRIKRWYDGESKWHEFENDPNSSLVIMPMPYTEYHWSARIARAIVGFYAFLGQQQTSTLDIEDGACSPIQASVVNTIEKYKQGAVVSAFVNPENPTAIRVANFSRGTNFYLMLFITALGFVGVVYLWRTPANKLVNRDAKKAALS